MASMNGIIYLIGMPRSGNDYVRRNYSCRGRGWMTEGVTTVGNIMTISPVMTIETVVTSSPSSTRSRVIAVRIHLFVKGEVE